MSEWVTCYNDEKRRTCAHDDPWLTTNPGLELDADALLSAALGELDGLLLDPRTTPIETMKLMAEMYPACAALVAALPAAWDRRLLDEQDKLARLLARELALRGA